MCDALASLKRLQLFGSGTVLVRETLLAFLTRVLNSGLAKRLQVMGRAGEWGTGQGGCG